MPEPSDFSMWPYSYTHVHELVHAWIDEGLLEFVGRKSHSSYCDLDSQILWAFGYLKQPTKDRDLMYDAHTCFDDDIIAGKLNLAWMNGPHAVTLYKVKLARMEK